jgi:hypothetical protein
MNGRYLIGNCIYMKRFFFFFFLGGGLTSLYDIALTKFHWLLTRDRLG